MILIRVPMMAKHHEQQFGLGFLKQASAMESVRCIQTDRMACHAAFIDAYRLLAGFALSYRNHRQGLN
jgi:hypothetical protein